MTLPHSVEAEQALLGSFLTNPQLLREIEISPSDFFVERNAWICQAASDLLNAGSPVDLLTISSQLDAAGRLEPAGGPAYLTGLVEAVPSSLHAEGYARIVRDLSVRRRLVLSAQKLAASALDPAASLDQALADFNASSSGLSSRQRGAQHVSEYALRHHRRIDAVSQNPSAVSGIPTGFAEYDALTGGLHNELLLVLGKPGLGKTKFVLQMAFQLAERGFPGAVYEFETCEDDILDREISRRTRIPTDRLERADLRDDEWPGYVRVIERLADPKLPLWLDFGQGWTTQALLSDLSRLKAEHGIRWFMVDYLKFVADRWGDSETERQNYISRQLKSITRQLDLAGVVIHSFNKEGLKADLPDLDNASQGADIMYDCDKALFIVDHIPEPGQLRDDCVKTFIFRKSRRRVKKNFFHLVSSPDFPDFQPLAFP